MARGRFVRASEIGEYVYCRRAWWLHHIVGIEPSGHARRARGTALHARHGRFVQLSSAVLLVGMLLLIVALVLLLV